MTIAIDSIRAAFTDLSKEEVETHMYESHNGCADTIEYAISNSRNILKGDCPLWGTFSVANSSFKVTTATKLCLTKTEGCMVFDLVHIGIYQYWDKIKAGVDEAWAELGVNSPLKVKQFPKEESNP